MSDPTKHVAYKYSGTPPNSYWEIYSQNNASNLLAASIQIKGPHNNQMREAMHNLCSAINAAIVVASTTN